MAEHKDRQTYVHAFIHTHTKRKLIKLWPIKILGNFIYKDKRAKEENLNPCHQKIGNKEHSQLGLKHSKFFFKKKKAG